MKAVIQRVNSSEVWVNGKRVSQIQKGILTLLGIEKGDTQAKVSQIIQKIHDLRIFEDNNGKMNLSLKDIKGDHLIVSQFTLAGSCKKGRRPSFDQAAPPEEAKMLYEFAVQLSTELGIPTQSGIFQANMDVRISNDGPVTFIIES